MDAFHSAIHQNLLLFTKVYPNLDMEGKLHPAMFKKPSTKVMQSVFYSLMYIINPEYCKKSVPWPLSFTQDNYRFRTSVIEFINKECPDFEVPALLPSLLNKVDGEKYVRFVFNFVTYITQKVLETKFGEVTLQKPNANLNCAEENLSLLDDVIVTSLADHEVEVSKHKQFVEKSEMFMNACVDELQTKLKEYQSKRQSVYADLKDALSYTNITEESAVECVFSSYEDEIFELKSQLEHVKKTVQSKIERKEYLLRLINMKKKLDSNVFGVDTFKSYITENLAQEIGVPLPTLMSNLFTNRGEIQLVNFLRYGHLVIQKQMQRALKLSPTDQQLAVYKSVDSLSSSTMKRLDTFRLLSTRLDGIIKDCQPTDSVLEVPSVGDDSDSSWVNLFVLLKSLDNYVPRLRIPAIEKPLLVDFRKDEDDADPMARMEKRMQLLGRKS